MKINWEEDYNRSNFYWGETKKDFLCLVTGLCGCGTGKDFRLLLEVLEFCALEGDEKYVGEGCYRSVEWELAAKVLDSVELIEHGTGIRQPWLTKQGRKALTIIRGLPEEISS